MGRGRGEAGGFEEGEHGGASGEFFDGGAEVLVGGFFASYDAGDEGEDAVKVEAVGGAQGWGGEREVEDEEVAAGVEDAGHFTEGGGP